MMSGKDLHKSLKRKLETEEEIKKERDANLRRISSSKFERRPTGQIFASIGQKLNTQVKAITEATQKYGYLTFEEIRNCKGPNLKEVAHKGLRDLLTKSPKLIVADERIDYRSTFEISSEEEMKIVVAEHPDGVATVELIDGVNKEERERYLLDLIRKKEVLALDNREPSYDPRVPSLKNYRIVYPRTIILFSSSRKKPSRAKQPDKATELGSRPSEIAAQLWAAVEKQPNNEHDLKDLLDGLQKKGAKAERAPHEVMSMIDNERAPKRRKRAKSSRFPQRITNTHLNEFNAKGKGK